MTQQRVDVTIARGAARWDVSLRADANMASAIAAIDPTFQGTAKTSDGASTNLVGRVSDQVHTGTVLELRDDVQPSQADLPRPADWVPSQRRLLLWLALAAGTTLALVCVYLLADALDLRLGSCLTATTWCACATATAIWAWRRDIAPKLAAQCLLAIAVVATGMLLLPNGVATLAPLVLAVAAATLVAVPALAPQAPAEQLIDIPLLATSALTQRMPATHAPSHVPTARAAGVVHDAETTWNVFAVLSSAAAATVAWPVITGTAATGIQAWACAVILVAALAVLTLTPVTSPLLLVRLVPRLAAVVIVAEWSVWLAFGGRPAITAPTLALCLLVLGAAAIGISLAATRDVRAPLMGRLGDIALSLAQVALFPAALVASGLFYWVWTWEGRLP